MPMTVLVTRNAPPRSRGFLASCMVEIAPGVYTSPRMSVAVRGRVWRVLEKWHSGLREEAYVMTWPARDQPGGQGVLSLGFPRTEVARHDGIHLSRRALSSDEISSLTTELDPVPF